MGSSLSRALLALIFIAAGTLHFVFPGAYEKVVPPYLPLRRELVYLSGALEVLGGLGLLPERTRRAADKLAWWVALLWARLPLQLALIAWVWRISRFRPAQ